LNSDPIHDGKDQFFQWMAVDPISGDAYVQFYDRRDDPANRKTWITLARSTDGGKTFNNYSLDDESFAAEGDFLGDYLAIATLGFGEIIRLLVLSDFLRPWLGGSQGVLGIPKPVLGGLEFRGPQQLFYLTLVASALVAFVAARLRDSRLGRAWMAVREDEDVAEALGINTVNVKLLAYGIGGAFAGISGAIFAVMLGSVFPHSFNVLISINVLALIIVGGMGSLPGVMVGSLALIGLPELLREFSDFRFLVYGAVLIVMMQFRPEGLWPTAVARRELHEGAAATAGGSVELAGAHEADG